MTYVSPKLGLILPQVTDAIGTLFARIAGIGDYLDGADGVLTPGPLYGASAGTVKRRGPVVEVVLNVTSTGASVNGTILATIPAAWRVPTDRYVAAVNTNSGAPIILQVAADGSIREVVARASGSGTLAQIMFLRA